MFFIGGVFTNMSNTTIPVFDPLNISFNPAVIDKCMGEGGLAPDCVVKWFCPQISAYFVRMGIIIIITYIVVSWALWWFLRYGWEHIDYETAPGWFFTAFGDLRKLETRIYWDSFVRNSLGKFMLGYIVVLVYFFIK